MKRADRKTKIEAVLKAAKAVEEGPLKGPGYDQGMAWERLIQELENMTEPEARMPRFNRLLRAIWVAATDE